MANRRRIDRAEQARKALSLAKQAGLLVLRLGALAAVVAAICGGVWAAVRWTLTTPRLAIDEITISGNERATEPELLRLLAIGTGENILRADLAAAHDRVSLHPWVRSVALARRFPQGIDLAVVERQPLALVDLGHLYLLDGSG